jgi:hypothetical protein
MSALKDAVLDRFDDEGTALNSTIIAECIRAALHEARECDEVVSEAEQRVATMLRVDFANLNIVEPFQIGDNLNFDRWTVAIRYPVGKDLVIDQDS